MVLVFLWDSEGTRVTDLNAGDLNYRNSVYFFVAVGLVCVLYSSGMSGMGLAGMTIPPIAVSKRRTNKQCYLSLLPFLPPLPTFLPSLLPSFLPSFLPSSLPSLPISPEDLSGRVSPHPVDGGCSSDERNCQAARPQQILTPQRSRPALPRDSHCESKFYFYFFKAMLTN